MLPQKKNRISAIGILTYNILMINGDPIEWIDLKETSLAALAKAIGIDEDHKAKVTITIEVMEQPCELCGKLATGGQLCKSCDKLICDDCAKTDATGRYCPLCYEIKKQPILS